MNLKDSKDAPDLSKKSDLEKLGEELRKIPGMAEQLDQAEAELKTMTYKVTVGSINVLGTALELVKMAWRSGVRATIAKENGTCMVTVGPINDFAAAVELVKLVSHSLPHVKFQVWGIPGNDPRNAHIVMDGPH